MNYLKKKNNKQVIFFLKREIIRLENEIVIFEIVVGTVHGRPPYGGFQKHSPYTSHWNKKCIKL
jgi:hypothetical protein